MSSVQITLRNVAHSPAVQQHINDYLAKLEHHIDNIVGCRVIITAPPKRPSKGKEYSIKLTLCLPNKELIVSNTKHTDLYIALHDAFQTILQQAESYLDWRNTKYNHVANISHGVIARLVPEEYFGFITDHDGNEYYFNDAHVRGRQFNKLMVGDKVTFTIVPTKHGMQAHHVSS